MEKPGKSLKARAVDLLSRREYTRLELKRRLSPFAENAEEVDALLDELAASRWQSDARFAEQFADSRSRKYGSRRVAMEMRERGVDSDTIKQTLSSHNDLATARSQWLRKFGQPASDAAGRAKQMRYLASRGFGMDTIRQVIKGSDEWPDDDAQS
ncbi:recombination regulator RecX [Vogesella mureinivorans]|uniref:recombination regulator RecX n=1 Tax=Vogesella mureinivorans TaxID=657276 RepID=UPI0011CC0167|nr:recombination regulator RecX [Vogesella mureinivorans]